MLSDEVLIGELLSVDGLATSALILGEPLVCVSLRGRKGTYVATGEVTSLEHEVRNDAVECRASVSEALLAGAESTEVLGSLWDNIVVELEVDTTRLLCERVRSAHALRGPMGWGVARSSASPTSRCRGRGQDEMRSTRDVAGHDPA